MFKLNTCTQSVINYRRLSALPVLLPSSRFSIRTVYGEALMISSSPPATTKRITLDALDLLKAQHIPIVVVTAADAPTAVAADTAGVDVVLVGDSLGMAALGLASTVPVTIGDMERVCAAVARGAGGDASRGAPTRMLLVGDLPFGTYSTPIAAIDAATRLFAAGAVAVAGAVEVGGCV